MITIDLDKIAADRRRVELAGGPAPHLRAAYARACEIVDNAPPLGDDLGAWPPLLIWAARLIAAAAAGGAAAAAAPAAYRTVGAVENALRWATHVGVALGLVWLWQTLKPSRRRR